MFSKKTYFITQLLHSTGCYRISRLSLFRNQTVQKGQHPTSPGNNWRGSFRTAWAILSVKQVPLLQSIRVSGARETQSLSAVITFTGTTFLKILPGHGVRWTVRENYGDCRGGGRQTVHRGMGPTTVAQEIRLVDESATCRHLRPWQRTYGRVNNWVNCLRPL